MADLLLTDDICGNSSTALPFPSLAPQPTPAVAAAAVGVLCTPACDARSALEGGVDITLLDPKLLAGDQSRGTGATGFQQPPQQQGEGLAGGCPRPQQAPEPDRLPPPPPRLLPARDTVPAAGASAAGASASAVGGGGAVVAAAAWTQSAFSGGPVAVTATSTAHHVPACVPDATTKHVTLQDPALSLCAGNDPSPGSG